MRRLQPALACLAALRPAPARARWEQGGNKLLIRYRAITTPPGAAAGLLAGVPPIERAAMMARTVKDWSRECWKMARTRLCGNVQFEACTGPVSPRSAIGEAQIVLRTQIARGGRAARLPDAALDGDRPEVAHPPRAAKHAA